MKKSIRVKGKFPLKEVHFNKTYRNYLISYLVVLLLPLFITIFGYLYSQKMVREEIYQYHFNLLKQTRQAYDQIVELVRAGASVTAANNEVQSLMQREEWPAEQLFNMLDLIGMLSGTKNSNPYCDWMGVYFYRSRNLVTNTRRYPEALLYQYADKLGLSEEEFIDKIQQGAPEGYFLLEGEEKGERQVCIVFCRNVYGSSFRDVLATILIAIPWGRIAGAASEIDLSAQGGLLLINSENRLIGNSNKQVGTEALTWEFFEDDSRLIPIRMNGVSYITSFLTSSRWDVKYGIYTPKNIFYRKLNYLRLAILVEVALCLLIGISLAAWFARETYNPIERLLILLDMKKQGTKDTVPYEKLEEVLHQMLQEHSSLEKQLTMRDQYVKNGVLVGLLKGWNQEEELAAWYLQDIQEKWESFDYRVILFELTHIEKCKLFEGLSEEEQIKALPLVMFSVKNVLEELLLGQEGGLILEVDGMAACIYNVSEGGQEGLMQQLQQCVDFYAEALELKSFAAVSSVHAGTEELSMAYEEAYETVSHKLFWGAEVADVLFYENEAQEAEKAGKDVLMQQERKLLNFLSAQDYQKAAELLDDMLDNGMQKDLKLLSYNRCRAYGLVSLILDALMEQVGGMEEEFFRDLNLSERLLSARTVAALKEEIHAIFGEITVYYNKRNEGEEPSWLLDVRKYLKENYADPNINISAIAERFHLSLSYMGRTYKKYSTGGEGMLDYIHRLRVARCKELLDQGETVKAAAEQTGYLDSKAMIRAFKRYEGITPGQYKKQGLL